MAGTTVARLQAVLDANTRDFDRGMDRSESKMEKVGKVAGLAGVAIAGGLAVGLSKSVSAAKDAEQAQIRLETALKNANVSVDKHGATIDAAIQKTSRLAALDDEDLSDAFAKLVQQSGNVTKATKDMALAADIARARHISLEAATKMVEKANLGSAAAFKRIGLVVPAVTDAQDSLRNKIMDLQRAYKKADDEQATQIKSQIIALQLTKDSAIASDKAATSQRLLGEAHKTFAGAAEAYGNSTAGAQERFQVAVENLQERIGKFLLPVLADLFTWGAKFMEWAERNWPKFEKVVKDAFNAIKPPIQAFIDIVKAVADQVQKHWGTIERNMKDLKTVVESVLKAITAALKLPLDLIKGDWTAAWNDLKTIVSNVIEGVKTLLTNQLDNVKALALALGRAAKNAFIEGVTGIGEFFLGVITGLKDMLVNQLDNAKTAATNFGKAIFNGIVGGVTGVAAAVWDLVNNILDKFVAMNETVIGWGLKVGGWILGGILDGLASVASAVWGVVKEIPTFLVEKINAAKDWAKDIGSAIIDAIVAALAGIGDAIWEKIKSETKSLPGRIKDALIPDIPFVGGGGDGRGPDVFGGGGNFPVAPSSFSGSLHGALPIMEPFAAAAARYGLVITAGKDDHSMYVAGTNRISDHYLGKALDVSNGVNTPQMAAFFRSLIGNKSVKQAFYDPIGSIYGGVLSSTAIGGHSDHVHVATYDQGGWLRPGWNLAWNGTGRPEPVGGSPMTVVLQLGGERLAELIIDPIRRSAKLYERRNGRTAFG